MIRRRQMTQAAAKNGRSGNLSVFYCEGRCIRVYSTSIDEFVIESMCSGVSMRIKLSSSDGIEFVTDGRIDPVQVNQNNTKWRISR